MCAEGKRPGGAAPPEGFILSVRTHAGGLNGQCCHLMDGFHPTGHFRPSSSLTKWCSHHTHMLGIAELLLTH